MKRSTTTPHHRLALTLSLCTALGLWSGIQQSAAVNLVNDTWIDGNRNTPASPTYSENGTDSDADGNLESAWFNSGGATTTLSVVDDTTPGGDQLLRGNVTPTGAISWVTYFTPEATPVTLVNPGDQMKITWVFSLTGLNAASTGQGFRVAVVNSPSAARVTTETTPGNSTYTGYALFGNMRSGTLANANSFAIMARTNLASAALLSASAAWERRANGADNTVPGYADNTPYTFTITFTRTVANELDINSTMTGAGLGVGGAGLSVSYVDPAPNTFTFDTFNTRPQTGNDTATTFDTSLFRVEFIPACVTASISAHPTNTAVALGQSGAFYVTAGGAAPTYQWQLSTDSGANWNNVSTGTGGTTANYSTAATTGLNNGNQFRCIINVTCDSSSVTSAVATLSVTLPKNLTWVGGGANLWDTTTANWTGDASLFSANDNVTFDNSGSATPAIDLVGTVNPNIITVNAAQDYTFGSTTSGSIGGSASLTKSGPGKLTLTTANSYTGKTTVNGGTLSVAGIANLGTTPASFTADQLTLNGGTIEFTASGSSAANRGMTLGASGGTISTPTGVDFVNTPITTGPGSLTKIGAGSLALNAANTYAGGTVISNGIVTVGNASGLGTGTATVAGGTLTFPNAITLGNSLHVAQDSTLTFASTANNAVVLNGNLTGTAGRTLTITPTGSSTATTRVRVNNGLTNSFTLDANLVLNGTFTFATYNNVGDQVYNGVISGPGIMGRRSPLAGVAGRTILNGDNTYSGGTVIADGAIGFGIDSTGSPTVTSGPIGTGPLSLENNPNTLHRLFASGGARTVGNAITWPAGVNQDLTIEGSDALTLTGDMDLGGSPRTIACNNSANTTLSGVISNGGLTKTGPGVLLLNGANTYVGPTTVSNGTLAGIGTIAGPLVVESPGVLAPGPTGLGTLTVNGDLTLNGTTTVDVNASTADEDLITGIATANYGGTLTINNLAGTLAAGQSYTLFNATTHNGTFASFSPATPGAGLSWSFANGVLSVIDPNAAPPTLNVSQTGNTLSFSWTGAFKLQAQTNSLSVGIANNWGDYPGGSTSPVNVTVDAANGSVFFRLINQ